MLSGDETTAVITACPLKSLEDQKNISGRLQGELKGSIITVVFHIMHTGAVSIFSCVTVQLIYRDDVLTCQKYVLQG